MSQIDGPESAGTARYLQADPVRAYISAVFAAKGMPAADAAVAAEALVRADLRGVWSHGVARVPMYCDRLDHGAAKADPAIKVERVAAAAALVDGDDGLGLVVARRAMAEAIALAEGSGIGLAGTRRSGHFGMAGLYALQAVEAGCIGMVFTNASRALPPFGAAEPFFGTSPMAFGVPTPEGKCLLVDLSMSRIARGKLKFAAQRGQPIPEGYALDAQGRPTTDGQAAFEGIMLPFGEHKGAALAWLMDVLGGVFTGAVFGGRTGNPFRDLDRPQGTGHLFIAIRANLFMALGALNERMGELDDRVKALPRAEGFDEILSPGEPEARSEARLGKIGIPLTPDVLDTLRATGDAARVPWPFD